MSEFCYQVSNLTQGTGTGVKYQSVFSPLPAGSCHFLPTDGFVGGCFNLGVFLVSLVPMVAVVGLVGVVVVVILTEEIRQATVACANLTSLDAYFVEECVFGPLGFPKVERNRPIYV